MENINILESLVVLVLNFETYVQGDGGRGEFL